MTVGTEVLTLLFTDIEGSTLLWERDPAGMDRAVDLHLALLRRIVAEHGGNVVKSTGDGIFATFQDPSSAATALDLLGHLERGGGYGQVWQAVGLAARLLADGGRTAEGALLLAAVAERPRLPAPLSDALIEGLAARLEADPGTVDLGQIRARASFLTDAEIVDTCRGELEDLLRS